MADTQETKIEEPEKSQTDASVFALFPNRLAITGIITDCLRQLFSSSSNLLHPQLKDFYWSAEQASEAVKAPYQLVIDNYHSFTLAKAGVRPCILVKAGNWQESRMVLGNKAMGVVGNQEYYKQIQGTHTVLVTARTVAQAELLAREVHGYLSHFGPVLREWMGLSRWEVPMIQEPTEMDGNLESIIISIPVQYELVYSWELIPEAARLLRQISVSAIMKNTDTNFQLGV